MKGLLSFGFPFFLKVVIPGIVGTLALSPVLACVGIKLEIDVWFVKRSFSEIALLFTGLSLTIGFILYFLDTVIYRFFAYSDQTVHSFRRIPSTCSDDNHPVILK